MIWQIYIDHDHIRVREAVRERMRLLENSEVSVVIPTRNCARTLERCLKSVIKEEPGEILAVDMLSTDETVNILKRCGVRTISNASGSLGYSRQLGVETTKGAFVMFVDSDMELGLGCVETLRTELEKNGWAGIHAMILSQENVSYWQRSEDEILSLFFNRVGPSAAIGTGAALFRRELLLRHRFDPHLRQSSEDVDICIRLAKNGHQMGISSALAYHHHRREFSAFARRRFVHGLGSAQLALKYRKIKMLVSPLQAALFYTIYAVVTRKARLVPHFLVGGITEFLGIVVGLSRTSSRVVDNFRSVRD